MNALTRSVAATVALTVSVSIAPAVSPAESTTATTTAPANLTPGVRHTPVRAAAVRVHVTVRKHRITRSRSGFRPGNTLFDLRSRGGGSAAIQLLRLRTGYTLAKFRTDLNSDNIRALRRIDRKVVFYGGMPLSKSGGSQFGAKLDAGHYFVFDFDHPRWVRLRVQGAPQRRLLPHATGSVNMVLDRQDHRFRNPRRLPRSGWLRQTNRTDEPHFMDMTKVKRSTSRNQIRMFFAGTGPQDPTWALNDYPGTFVISPGRTVVWRYDYPPGKYLELCFWPSDQDGTSHAEMGMWNFITLH